MRFKFLGFLFVPHILSLFLKCYCSYFYEVSDVSQYYCMWYNSRMGLMMIWRNLGNRFSVFMFGDSATSLTCSHEVCPSSTLLLIQPLYSCLPSISHSLSLSPRLGFFRCHSSSHSLSAHLSFIDSISTHHSGVSALFLTASIDLHLLLLPCLSVLSLSSKFFKFYLLSVGLLHPPYYVSSLHFFQQVSGVSHSSRNAKIKPSLSFSLIWSKLILNSKCKATVTHTHTYFRDFHSVVS